MEFYVMVLIKNICTPPQSYSLYDCGGVQIYFILYYKSRSNDSIGDHNGINILHCSKETWTSDMVMG